MVRVRIVPQLLSQTDGSTVRPPTRTLASDEGSGNQKKGLQLGEAEI
jgi:hypothetical protein